MFNVSTYPYYMSKKTKNINIWFPEEPYNNLPVLPPFRDLETTPVLKACIDARVALAELNQLIESIPDSTMLINLLSVLEAKGSSEIENIFTTEDKLYEFASKPNLKDFKTKEAHNYTRALKLGYESLRERPLSTKTIIDVCSILKDMQMDVRKTTGTVLSNSKGKVVYTPPVGEGRIRDLLSNWEKFIHESKDIDPLVTMAVAHYQLEAIHPFIDGNGRTGRIVNLLFLVEKNLLKPPVLYLSRYILNHKSDYYDLLLSVTKEQNWEAWVLYMLEAVKETSNWTKNKIILIQELMDSTRKDIQTLLPKIYSYELVEVLFSQPYCRIQDLVDKKIAKRQTASEYLQKLSDKNILGFEQRGKEKLFINKKLLKLMKL